MEYVTIDDRVLALVVGPRHTGSPTWGRSRRFGGRSRPVLFGLRRLLLGTRFSAVAMSAVDQALTRLSQQLMAPLGVPPDAPLVVVPSGRLLGMPWSPLRHAPVSLAPSGSLWARTRPMSPNEGTRVALVAGPGLPGTAEEVRFIQEDYVGARTLLLPDSTVDGWARQRRPISRTSRATASSGPTVHSSPHSTSAKAR